MNTFIEGAKASYVDKLINEDNKKIEAIVRAKESRPADVEVKVGSQIEEFWTRKEITDSGCWEYTKSLSGQGYGQMWFAGEPWTAHRLSYALTHDGVPDDMMVRHTCDNRKCFNPEHLTLGTNADNMQDVRERGTGKVVTGSGEEHYNAKVTGSIVTEIRQMIKDDYPTGYVAEKFGMSSGDVWRYAVGKAWSDHPGAVDETYLSPESKAQRVLSSGVKRCKACHDKKPVEAFGYRSKPLDGRASKCKECITPGAKFRRSEEDLKGRVKA